jgi:hypothetical protein
MKYPLIAALLRKDKHRTSPRLGRVATTDSHRAVGCGYPSSEASSGPGNLQREIRSSEP